MIVDTICGSNEGYKDLVVVSVGEMGLDEQHVRTIASSIDHLVTTETRMPGPLAGYVKELYRGAHDIEGEPLSLAAARALRETVDEGDTVVIATGAGKGRVNLPNGETDGPLGAVGIARALTMALDARPILAAEDHCVDPLVATARAGGFNAIPVDELLERRRAVSVVPYTTDAGDADAEAERFLETYDPAALIAVEKGGPNAEGVYHSATGTDMSPGRAKIAPLFERANDAGVLTVSVGDNGNEIGFGIAEETVREAHPFGDTCRCPCGGGIACSVSTDHLVVANTSNWGAYGVEAMLALLTETPGALHAPDEEVRMLEQNVLHGSNDGLHDRPIPMVDGTSKRTQSGVVALLTDIVSNALVEDFDRAF